MTTSPNTDCRMLACLISGGALAGAVGGALRIVADFMPDASGAPWLEAFYAVIDIGMLFGLLAIWLSTAEAIGAIGLAGFVIALTGLASIVGPDSHAFGIDFYLLGAGAFMLGLTVLAIQLLRRGVLVVAAWSWLGAAVAGVIFTLSAAAPALVASSVLLGLGYVAAARAIRA